MSPWFTATTYTGISNGKMKSEEQGEDGDEVDKQFFSSYPHCRRCKTESLEHQRAQILFLALKLREIKAKEDNLIALATTQLPML